MSNIFELSVLILFALAFLCFAASFVAFWRILPHHLEGRLAPHSVRGALELQFAAAVVAVAYNFRIIFQLLEKYAGLSPSGKLPLLEEQLCILRGAEEKNPKLARYYQHFKLAYGGFVAVFVALLALVLFNTAASA
jgi:hypothetical protein